MYNVPSRTVANLAAETIARLSEIGNIVALKEASTDLAQCAAVTAGVRPGFRVYSGEDGLTLSMLAVGFHGVVSVAGHFAGPGIRRMVEAFVAGDVEQAQRLNAALQPIFREIFCTTSPVPTKALLPPPRLRGRDTRLPLVMDEISDDQLGSSSRATRALGGTRWRGAPRRPPPRHHVRSRAPDEAIAVR